MSLTPWIAGGSGLKMNHSFVIALLPCLILQNKHSLLLASPRELISIARLKQGGCSCTVHQVRNNKRKHLTGHRLSPGFGVYRLPEHRLTDCSSKGAGRWAGNTNSTLVFLPSPLYKLHVQTQTDSNFSSN